MDKRYQVFVSSTFADLQDERQEVMQALLELECIPSGMELFPAANEDQWSLIKKVIDDCDYYMVIVAGRYGSIGPDGFSYTEMEYRYAIDIGKPVLGFLHKTPGSIPSSKTESSEDGKTKLKSFRELVQKKMCRFWDGPADLGSQVSRSLVKLIKTNPGIGWVRGDLVPTESNVAEILKLRRQIEDLESQLAQSRTSAPAGTGQLAQGSDEFQLVIRFRAAVKDYETGEQMEYSIDVTWDDIFGVVSPLLIHEASEAQMASALATFAREQIIDDLNEMKELKGLYLKAFSIHSDSFQTVKIQLRALGLIAKSSANRSVKDTATYWTLTPYGDTVMTKIRAIQRSGTTPHSEARAAQPVPTAAPKSLPA